MSSTSSAAANGKDVKPTNPAVASGTELDLTNSKRGVWLVKVPKYISQRWENAKEQTEVGKLLISKGADGVPEIKFNLSEELLKVPVSKSNDTSKNGASTTSSTTSKSSTATSSSSVNNKKQNDPLQLIALPKKTQPQVKNSLIGTKKDIVYNQKELEIPKEHKFAISDISHQHLAVFSEQYDEQQKTKRLVLEGNVVQKGECRPIADSLYMDLKKQRIVEARQPTRLVQQLDKAVVNYKPLVSNRAEAETKRKNDQKKSREDRDKVQDMLFTAFENHQYYYLKDLEKITKQPVSYLKDILREIAIFNSKMPHKNQWELKAQFRHYKPDQPNEN